MDKKKAKKALYALSDEKERQDLSYLEIEVLQDKLELLQKDIEIKSNETKILKEAIAESHQTLQKTRQGMKEFENRIQQSFGQMLQTFAEKIEQLGGTITTSYEKNKPYNAAGSYKDMLNQLSIIDESIKKKPVPVWNWPQYAAVSVRNKNYANINPSIAAFGIEDYDDVQLTNYDANNNPGTVTYYLNGIIKAVLTLTYSGSNLTRAQRTQ